MPAFVVALVLVVVAPGLESAFHTPKSVVLAVGLVVALPVVVRRWRMLPLLPLGFVAAVSVSATWSDSWSAPSTSVLLLGGLTVATWKLFELEPERVAKVLAPALVVVCGLVVLQSLGVFTFGATGRMARSSTLGNPDFVASVVGVLGWLMFPLARRWLPMLVLVTGALVVTQSFASLAALGLSALFVVVHPSMRSKRLMLAVGAVLVLALVSVGVTGRSLERSARGRWYLTQVALPHVVEAPVFGLGPGALELHWPQWELELWTKRCGEDAACVAAHPDFEFNGLQRHLHDDWLELLIEVGVPGVLSMAFVLISALGRSWRASSPFVGAALVSFVTRGFFDFPLHRPADWAALAVVLSIGATERRASVWYERS
ncbi:MAG: O-antigen ligase family protein [Myxococcales bacterium]|nr:O-antigen ligase family protein [Myxococcales bacterium]